MTKWLDIAEGEVGQKEVRGEEKHNPRILEYHATTTLGNWGRSRDETPWCSSFVNWCFHKAGVEGTDNALARSWITWGEDIFRREVHSFSLALYEWELGDVMVIKRKRKGSDRRTGSRGGYHVGFPYRVTNKRVLLLGGNQRDAVSFARFSRRRYDVIAICRAS